MLIFKPIANGYKAYWVLNIKPRKYDILFKNFQQDRTTTTHSHQVGKATSEWSYWTWFDILVMKTSV